MSYCFARRYISVPHDVVFVCKLGLKMGTYGIFFRLKFVGSKSVKFVIIFAKFGIMITLAANLSNLFLPTTNLSIPGVSLNMSMVA